MNIKNNEYGMFRVHGPEDRTLVWDNLVFTRERGSGFSAGVRVGDLFSRERTTPYSLVEAPITTMTVRIQQLTGIMLLVNDNGGKDSIMREWRLWGSECWRQRVLLFRR